MAILISVFLAFSALAVEPVPNSTLEQLTTLDGQKFSTDKNRLLVYYWASWCTTCVPKLRYELEKMKMPEGGQLITVNTDKDLERAKHFINEQALKLPVMRDDGKALSQPLKAYAVPFWAVLQRDGSAWKVLAAKAGGTADEMNKALWQ